MQPLIGLTTYGRGEIKVDYPYYEAVYAIPADYIDAVRRAGGVPVLLPPGETGWDEILAAVDGIILIGGADIDPIHYGGNRENPALTQLAPDRDSSELKLARDLIDSKDHPTLAICRGLQVVNVAAGGTLTEHIPDIMPEDIHRSETGGWASQPVEVKSESQLARIMAAQSVTTHSGHHQAVKKVADSLKVTAVAADGIVEGLEAGDHPWLIAVQWHPEVTAGHDPTQQRLFDELVRQAAIRRAERQSSSYTPGQQEKLNE